MSRATVFAPRSVGNVGPGFDILGLAIDEIGDRVTVELGKSEASPMSDGLFVWRRHSCLRAQAGSPAPHRGGR